MNLTDNQRAQEAALRLMEQQAQELISRHAEASLARKLQESWAALSQYGSGAAAVAPKPEPAAVAVSEAINGPSAEYLALAEKIGAVGVVREATRAQRIASFERHIASMGLREYKRENVERYLIAEARKASPGVNFTVYWLPLREQDKHSIHPYMNALSAERLNALYSKPIPMPVLETVASIAEAFPEVKFYVSDVAAYPDPFLLVNYEGRAIICERWDEPSYREE